MSWSIFNPDNTLVERGDDDTRAVYGPTGSKVRDYTQSENAAADDAITAAARMDDLEARVARIEAHLWPADEQPNTAPTWDDLGGVWPAGTLLSDDGVVYRNVSGVPLTTPPSAFPGSPDQWGHLFRRVTSPEPEPEPDPDAPAWAEGVSYKVGDLVIYSGSTYRCAQAHTSQAGWSPADVPALWTPA